MPDQLSLIVPGVRTQAAPDPQVRQYLRLEDVQSFDIASARRGGGAPDALVQGPPDSIVKLEYESGLFEYLRLDQFHSELGVTRDGGPARVPTSLERGEATARGASEWILKALHIFGVSPAQILASETAEEVVAHFDGRRKDSHGLFHIAADGSLQPDTRNRPVPPSPQPYLLFIHGTASSTEGSFGGFWNIKTKDATPEWKDLTRRYEGRILALEHPTFSVSPAQNALDLLQLLPDNVTLHVLTHSRGGLVGELLGLGDLASDQLDAFSGRPDRDLLHDLSGLLARKKPKVEKFVRTACPAAGTVLASKRLDLYLNLILNAIGLVPGLAENPFYELFKATAIELIKLRADPDRIPGIEAQMPESPFIHLLNTRGRYSDADLGVIAGDFQRSGIGGALAGYALRAFYWEQNDFVVNTRSMSGGMDRKRPVRRFFDQGGNVNHFSYFKNASSRSKVIDWLSAAPGAPVEGFAHVRGAKAPTRGAPGSDRLPLAVVVPDVFGSHILASDDTPVWLNYDALARGAFVGLDWQLSGADRAPRFHAGTLLPVYERLLDRLSITHDVLPFAYDWRQPVAQSARLLLDAVRQNRGADRPVRIVGHGMGGLVAREMALQMGDAEWSALTANGGLWVLGTPNRGSWRIARLLAGRGRLSRMLALLGRHTVADVAAALRGFPGLVDLLPQPMLNVANWNQASLDPPPVDLLMAASAWRSSLSPQAPARTVYIAGSAPFTPDGLDSYTEAGDGDVPYALSGFSEGSPKIDWYHPDAAHGDLISSAGPLVELLSRGITANYDTSPPHHAGTLDRERVAAADAAVFFPAESDLLDAALVRAEEKESADESLTVRVTHGHVRAAKFPVAVGHYVGDSIVSAEREIDRQLGGRLSARFQMDLYPGPSADRDRPGTVEVVHAPGCNPPGALVIGIGEIGEITAEKVRRGIFEACTKYALMRLEEPSPADAGPRSAAISSVLIGVSGGRAISVSASVNAIVLGVIEANRMLKKRELLDRVRIDQVEFVELYEDSAGEAMEAVSQLSFSLRNALESVERVAVDLRLRSHFSGLDRRPPSQYATGWWRRILVTGDGDGGHSDTADGVTTLKFENLTDRARSEQSDSISQTSLVNTLLEDVTSPNVYDEASAATLYELLIPNALKDQSLDGADLVLVVDSAASRYPWELMAIRTHDRVSPLSVRVGMLRQLKSRDFASGPRGSRDHGALVIGDPIVSPSGAPGYPPLPGARAEAQAVAEELGRHGYTATTLLGEAPATIIRHLFAREYRIMHLAGHGVYDPANPARSGMVLRIDPANPAASAFLTSLELGQLHNMPDLVFINCCHLANIDQPLPFPAHRLAASIAERLISMGVRAVVAAGWAVDDTAAAEFAGSFYRSMLEGRKFGESVRTARQDTYKLGHNNTWGAYQCYGNPDFTLAPALDLPPPIKRGFHARQEALKELHDIVASSEGAGAGEIAALKERTFAVEASLGDGWRDGQTLFHLGEAYKCLNDFERAIVVYREAIRQEKSAAPIATVEQLANLLDRNASRLYRSDPQRAVAHWDEAAALLEKLRLLLDDDIQKNRERLSLLGALYKRRRHADLAVERQYLKKSSGYYSEAYEYSRDRLGQIHVYSGLNAITSAWLGGLPMPEFQAACIAEAKRARDADSFWDRVSAPDALLLEFLTGSNLAGHEDEVIHAYRDVFHFGRPNEIDSVIRQIQLLHDRGPADRSSLEKILDNLR
jgi:CHAT domain-containing protein